MKPSLCECFRVPFERNPKFFKFARFLIRCALYLYGSLFVLLCVFGGTAEQGFSLLYGAGGLFVVAQAMDSVFEYLGWKK